MKRDIDIYSQDYVQDKMETVFVHFRRKKVLDFLNQYKPKRILEIGCGVDPIFVHYKDFQSYTVVEPSAHFIETVKQKYPLDFSGIHWIHDFLENSASQLESQEFDFILLSCLLHEVENPKLLLDSVYQIANEQTIVHVDVPNNRSFHLLWAYESGLMSNPTDMTTTGQKYQRHSTFNLDSLKNIVNECGFQVIDSGSYFFKPFNNAKFQKLIEENLIDENLLNGLYKMTNYFPDYGAEIYINCKKMTNA